jgi:hypothetical protein
MSDSYPAENLLVDGFVILPVTNARALTGKSAVSIGTGDGIVVPTLEHYGRATRQMPREYSPENFEKTRNRVRTAPLWGVRLRSRLMHDGVSVTLRDAILRHAGKADQATHGFRRLSSKDQEAIVEFLQSL